MTFNQAVTSADTVNSLYTIDGHYFIDGDCFRIIKKSEYVE